MRSDEGIYPTNTDAKFKKLIGVSRATQDVWPTNMAEEHLLKKWFKFRCEESVMFYGTWNIDLRFLNASSIDF